MFHTNFDYVYDYDRTLRSGYISAASHIKADIVLFLGDLLDDGSIVDDATFAEYAGRFRRVFEPPSHVDVSG